MILVLQTRRVLQAAEIEFLRLFSTTTPTEAPSKSQGEQIIEFGNTYWLMLFGLFLVLSGLYKAWELCLRWWPREVGNYVTCSSLILHIFGRNYGIYIRLFNLDGVHSQLVITSSRIIDNLVLVSYIMPVLSYTWEVSLQNNITGVITCPGRTARVTWGQAWRFRRLMTREFTTEVYLLTGSELRVVRSEGVEEQPVDAPVLEYMPIHSPRGGSAMGGGSFFCPH